MNLNKFLSYIPRYFALSVIVFIVATSVSGFKWGYNFVGGVSVSCIDSAPVSPIFKSLDGIKNLGVNQIKNNKSLKFVILGATSNLYSEVMNKIKLSGYGDLCSVSYSGPSYSKMFWRRSLIAAFISFSFVTLYLVTKYSWQLAGGGALALIHDCLSTLTTIAIFKISFDMTTMIALLTIFGYSVNNTIVVFDEVCRHPAFLSGAAVTLETRLSLIRSVIDSVKGRVLMTTLTTLIPVLAILIFVGSSGASFAVPMICGLLFGGFSSVFISPILYAYYGSNRFGGLYAR